MRYLLPLSRNTKVSVAIIVLEMVESPVWYPTWILIAWTRMVVSWWKGSMIIGRRMNEWMHSDNEQ